MAKDHTLIHFFCTLPGRAYLYDAFLFVCQISRGKSLEHKFASSSTIIIGYTCAWNFLSLRGKLEGRQGLNLL